MALKKKSGKKKSISNKTSSKKKAHKKVVGKTIKKKTKTKAKTKAKTKPKAKPKTKTKPKAKTEAKTKPTTTKVAKPKKVLLNATTIKIREQLTTNKQELLNIIQTNQSAERNSTESNFSNEIDMASDLEGREMMFQLTSRDLNELKRIQDAIYRIDHGTYGICDVCSKGISQKRLKILPLSSLCIDCKEEMERL